MIGNKSLSCELFYGYSFHKLSIYLILFIDYQNIGSHEGSTQVLHTVLFEEYLFIYGASC